MKKNLIPLCLISTAVMLSGCELVGDIFGAGVKVGIFLVIIVVIIILLVIRKVFGGRKD